MQTVLCLHGIGGDDGSFLPQSVTLSTYFRVVVCNMPGYRNSIPLDSMTFENLANSLQHLVAVLDCGPVHIIGQSIGGMIAQEFYHRYPDSVASLCLVATTTAFGGRDDSFKNDFLDARLKPLELGHSMEQIATQAVPTIVAAGADETVVQSAIRSMASVDAQVYRQVLRCLVTFNRRREWPEIACPVCIVSGSEDTNAAAATMRKMADKLPHAEYHEVHSAGHLVNLEKGSEFNDIVSRFISAHKI